MSGAAIAALKATLAPGEDLEIIMDRRDEKPSAQLPLIERRHHPDVDLALARDGFALVPAETPRPAAHGSPKVPRAPSTPEVARLVLRDEEARELERVLGFKRRRGALRRRLIPVGLAIGIGILALLVSPSVQTLLSPARPVAPHVADAPRPTPAPPVVAAPSPKAEVLPPPRAVRARSSEERPRESSTSTRELSGPSAAVPPKPVKETSPPVAFLPQADVTRTPAPTSEGGGETYVVRLSDQAGRPAAGARVSLIIRMTNGTLLDIPLGSGPEPGTYHATVPPLDLTPLDLRIRVATNDKRVEIPLTP